jgi:transposase-like protein
MHLRWGTHKDNAKDRLERTGYAGNRGEKNPNWVQTDEVVTAALSLVECTAKEAAKKVGVSQPTILRIWRDNGVLPRKAAPPPKAQDRALIHLTSLGAGWVGVSVSEMARDLGMASPNLHRALHELLRNGRVAKRGGGLGKVAEWKVLTP